MNPQKQARPPLERMLRIHRALQSRKYPNAKKLGAEIEVSAKTIQRDMEFMRDRMSLPIRFSPRKNGYYYSDRVKAFPSLQITEGELFALIVAERALQQYRGTPFEKPLLSALEKLEQSLPDTISLNLSDISKTISFRTRTAPVLDFKALDTLAKAVSQRKQLEIVYRKPGAKDPEPRLVDPYHLANINGEWFLFAFDHGRNDIRTFVPARIQSITLTDTVFTIPEGFSLEERLRGSFGVHSGDGTYEVVLRFSSRAADYVNEKTWHETQRLRRLKDGGIELTMTLSSLAEVERWILGWSGDVKVVKPAELVQSVKQAATRILQINA